MSRNIDEETAWPRPPDISVKAILKSRALSDRDFDKISSLMYDLCRINLHAGKKEFVQARLNKRLRRLGIDTYRDYLNYVRDDASGAELAAMINILTTNLTCFFRESDHFDYLRDEVLKNINPTNTGKVRLWSAGCSSGEEAYSMAILIREHVANPERCDVKILATDISSKMLAIARSGVFKKSRFKDMPALIRDQYFTPLTDQDGEIAYMACKEICGMVHFRRLNLMSAWPMKGNFDVVLCRNVMIYFDKATQSELINRFYDVIRPGGVFMVGHSESLTGVTHNFKYVRPSIYIKP